MSLDVICDVSISGEIKSLEILKPVLFETLKSVIENTDLVIENYKVLNNDPDYFQVFFSTRYEAPIQAIKNLSIEYADLVFILTYDDQIGNDGRIQFYGELEKKLEYVSEFREAFNKLMSEGILPPHGIIFTGKDENDLNNKILLYAENQGYDESGQHDKDEAGFAMEWLDDNVGMDYGCFETEDLNFIFRPWEKHES